MSKPKISLDTTYRFLQASGAIRSLNRPVPILPMRRRANMNYRYLGLGIAIGLALWALWSWLDGADAQTRHQVVPCWPVANGAAQTIQCANGYWVTTMPDGTVIDGMGIVDPNASQPGSRIQINPNTSWPTGGVIPPDGTVQTPGPGQWWYGHPAPQ